MRMASCAESNRRLGALPSPPCTALHFTAPTPVIASPDIFSAFRRSVPSSLLSHLPADQRRDRSPARSEGERRAQLQAWKQGRRGGGGPDSWKLESGFSWECRRRAPPRCVFPVRGCWQHTPRMRVFRKAPGVRHALALSTSVCTRNVSRPPRWHERRRRARFRV